MDRRNFADIQVRQQAIVKIDIDIKTMLDTLSQTRFENQRDLAMACSKVKSKLKMFDDNVNQLEQLAGKIKAPSDRAEMTAQVTQHKEEFDRNHRQLRNVTAHALQRIEQDQKDALFHRSNGSSLAVEGADARMKQRQSTRMRQEASKTTDSLSNLLSKMGDQVKLSEDTTTTLVGSSSVLQESEREFHQMGSTIQSGGKLISKYGRREITDKFLIALALCLFFGTVYYILRKRVLRYFW